MRLLVTGGAGFIGSNFVRGALGAAGAAANVERLVVVPAQRKQLDALDHVLLTPFARTKSLTS